MFDDASRQEPANEELAIQVFLAYMRIKNWKATQQVRHDSLPTFFAHAQHRLLLECTSNFKKRGISIGLLCQPFFRQVKHCPSQNLKFYQHQANEPTTDPKLKALLFKLAHRLIASSPTPPYQHPERFHLHLTLVRELELWEEADKLLTSNIGKDICSTSLACEELRRDIWQRRGLWVDDGDIAKDRIVEKQ